MVGGSLSLLAIAVFGLAIAPFEVAQSGSKKTPLRLTLQTKPCLFFDALAGCRCLDPRPLPSCVVFVGSLKQPWTPLSIDR